MIFYLIPAAAGRPAMLQPTQADANREAKERGLKVRAPDMEHEVPTVKADLMAYINNLLINGSFNGGYLDPSDETVGTVTGDPQSEDEPPTKPSYIAQSVNFDEQFEKLPVAHQLHFAALAMENARNALPEGK